MRLILETWRFIWYNVIHIKSILNPCIIPWIMYPTPGTIFTAQQISPWMSLQSWCTEIPICFTWACLTKVQCLRLNSLKVSHTRVQCLRLNYLKVWHKVIIWCSWIMVKFCMHICSNAAVVHAKFNHDQTKANLILNLKISWYLIYRNLETQDHCTICVCSHNSQDSVGCFEQWKRTYESLHIKTMGEQLP